MGRAARVLGQRPGGPERLPSRGAAPSASRFLPPAPSFPDSSQLPSTFSWAPALVPLPAKQLRSSASIPPPSCFPSFLSVARAPLLVYLPHTRVAGGARRLGARASPAPTYRDEPRPHHSKHGPAPPRAPKPGAEEGEGAFGPSLREGAGSKCIRPPAAGRAGGGGAWAQAGLAAHPAPPRRAPPRPRRSGCSQPRERIGGRVGSVSLRREDARLSLGADVPKDDLSPCSGSQLRLRFRRERPRYLAPSGGSAGLTPPGPGSSRRGWEARRAGKVLLGSRRGAQRCGVPAPDPRALPLGRLGGTLCIFAAA